MTGQAGGGAGGVVVGGGAGGASDDVSDGEPDPGQGVLGADDVRVLAGNPTAEEIAAATAVLAALIAEMSDAEAELLDPLPSAWQRSQRPIRGPIQPGLGRWRGFTG